MRDLLLHFGNPDGTTWLYLSLILVAAVFVRWSRLLSLRTFDYLALFLLVPGLLATDRAERLQIGGSAAAATFRVGPDREAAVRDLAGGGFAWLFLASGYWLLRCGLDVALTRRPRLDPNLNNAGLTVLGVALLAFTMIEIVSKPPDPVGLAAVRAAHRVPRQTVAGAGDAAPVDSAFVGVFVRPVGTVVRSVASGISPEPLPPAATGALADGIARTSAILCHLAILAALVLCGWRHFGSTTAGIAMATLYLLVPLTAINAEKMDQLLPAAFILWAVHLYRRPLLAGGLLGLAALSLFPLLLLPLWLSFYWGRGGRRFLAGFAVVTLACWTLVWWLDPVRSYLEVWTSSLAWQSWDATRVPTTLSFWDESVNSFRIPLTLLLALTVALTAFWPRRKTLADLIALSSLLIVLSQFCYGDRGGAYTHWYLPLLMLMIFRPNLRDAMPKPRP